MTRVDVTVNGLGPLVRKLDRIAGTEAIRRGMTRAVLFVQSKVAKYPPHTSANVPPGNNGYSWYVRGSGTYTTTGKTYLTSENLGQRWTTRISAGGKRGHIENNASYAEYVQSRDKQAAFHGRNGWQTVEDTVEDHQDKILQFFQQEYDRALGG